MQRPRQTEAVGAIGGIIRANEGAEGLGERMGAADKRGKTCPKGSVTSSETMDFRLGEGTFSGTTYAGASCACSGQVHCSPRCATQRLFYGCGNYSSASFFGAKVRTR